MAAAKGGSNNNIMNYTLLKKMIEVEISSGKEQDFSYMIEGPHGIGKSAIIIELALLFDAFLIDLRLGQRDLGDVLGMPHTFSINGELHFGHIQPDLIRAAFVQDLKELGVMGDAKDVLAGKGRDPKKHGQPYKNIFFFADEYNRGTKDVQQSMFELVYDRRMSGKKLSPKTWVFAACNDNMDVYTVTEGDPAFRSRFKTIKYTPTPDEYIKWGQGKNPITGEQNLCDELIHVFSAQKNIMDPPKDKDIDYLNQPHPNRRSWHHFSMFFVAHRTQFTEVEMRDVCATYVGSDAAEVFRLLVSKMKETQSKHETADSTETKKVKELYAQYFQYQKWDRKQAEEVLSQLNPSEMNTFGDLCIEQFNKYKFITQVTKDRVLEFSEFCNQELFARIWNSVSTTYEFKQKVEEHAKKQGKDLSRFNKV